MVTQDVRVVNIINPVIVSLEVIKTHGITSTIYMNPKSITFSNFNKVLPENPSLCRLEIDNVCVFQIDAKKVKFIEEDLDNSLYSRASFIDRFNLTSLIQRAYTQGTPISIIIDTTDKDYLQVDVH